MASKQTPTTDKAAPKTKRMAAAKDGASAAEARWQRTAIAAFYRAQARGFLPGKELEDWLEAEREVDAAEAAATEAGATAKPRGAASGLQDAGRAEQHAAATPPGPDAGSAAKSARPRRGKSIQGSASSADIQARDRGDVSR
jgi:hypothetical protein